MAMAAAGVPFKPNLREANCVGNGIFQEEEKLFGVVFFFSFWVLLAWVCKYCVQLMCIALCE